MNTRKRDTFARHTDAERKSAKQIARNTWRYIRADGADTIRLHNTDVAWALNGQVTFDSGGFRTITTKDRMNLLRPGYSVYSLKGRWHARCPDGDVPFVDGVTLPRDVHGVHAEKVERVAAKEDKLKDALNAFCRLLLDTSKPVPLPDPGDCFYCQMRAVPAEQRGQPGDGTGKKDEFGSDHLREHIREKYMHGSLLVNAMRWAGYRDVGIAVHLGVHGGGADRKHLAQVLRRYLKFQLGIGEAR